MKHVNIHAAKTHLSRLIADVLAGEEVIIAKAGTPLVRLVPVTPGDGPRTLGLLQGTIVERDDCWAPDADTETLFYGGAIEPSPAHRVAEPRRPWYAKPEPQPNAKSSTRKSRPRR